jgi:hypothetical protein
MATATQEPSTKPAPAHMYAPANWDEYVADKDRRAAARQKNRKTMLECLDPEKAAQYELKKDKFEFRVKCTFRRPNEKGKLESKTEELTVTAQNENDAWAMFCDNIGTWPSRKNADCEIQQIRKA